MALLASQLEEADAYSMKLNAVSAGTFWGRRETFAIKYVIVTNDSPCHRLPAGPGGPAVGRCDACSSTSLACCAQA